MSHSFSSPFSGGLLFLVFVFVFLSFFFFFFFSISWFLELLRGSTVGSISAFHRAFGTFGEVCKHTLGM